MAMNCEYCNEPFPPNAQGTRRFCSGRCRKRAEKRRLHPYRRYLKDACEACGFVPEHHAQLAIDHIRPRAEGGTNSPANLQTLCHNCHILKTVRERPRQPGSGGRSEAERQRALRQRRASQIRDDPTLAPHGRVSTYTGWGCRCDLCRTAKAWAWQEYKKQNTPEPVN